MPDTRMYVVKNTGRVPLKEDVDAGVEHPRVLDFIAVNDENGRAQVAGFTKNAAEEIAALVGGDVLLPEDNMVIVPTEQASKLTHQSPAGKLDRISGDR